MFRKYVRNFYKNLLTFENVFYIIALKEQAFTNIYSEWSVDYGKQITGYLIL